MRRKMAAGNWKMNGTAESLSEIDALSTAFPAPNCDVLICPPATLINRLATRVGDSAIAIGGQDCHISATGAHTGDISAEMLVDAGASHVIVGHSERRTDHDESNADVNSKAAAAWRAGLTAVICVGETLSEREEGRALSIVGKQVEESLPDDANSKNTVIAYEPIWAIGTGKVPTPNEIAEVHDGIRVVLARRLPEESAGIRLLYGGSVKPSNADEIFSISNVDGALVGGASLKAPDFGGIIAALEAASD
ncbi:MAG: triose-phosphate isomerase [Boseongicola sp.]